MTEASRDAREPNFSLEIIDRILRSDNPCREAALVYAAHGIPVFPCKSDKGPLIKWREGASTDTDTIKGWWTTWPNALVAIVTGVKSNLFVLDLDVKNGNDGVAAYKSLGLPRTEVGVRTASGGGHAYFECPGPDWTNKNPRLGQGIDARGEGGCVIAPPSCIGGEAYLWYAPEMLGRILSGDRPVMPEALMNRLRPIMEPAGTFLPAPAPVHPGKAMSRYGAVALEEETAAVANAQEGTRNPTLNNAAFNLGQLVGVGELNAVDVEQALTNAALSCGLGAEETRKTFASGFAAGIATPRSGAGDSSGTDPSRLLAASDAADDWPEPDLTLLQPDREDPPDCPVREIFGMVWGGWIETAADARNAPVDYVVAALLAIAASLLGNSRRAYVYGDWRESCILWIVLVGPPSSRKSPGLKAVREPLEELQKALEARAEPELEDWRNKAEAARLLEEVWKENTKQTIRKA
jgi:hypothetical protein